MQFYRNTKLVTAFLDSACAENYFSLRIIFEVYLAVATKSSMGKKPIFGDINDFQLS